MAREIRNIICHSLSSSSLLMLRSRRTQSYIIKLLRQFFAFHYARTPPRYCMVMCRNVCSSSSSARVFRWPSPSRIRSAVTSLEPDENETIVVPRSRSLPRTRFGGSIVYLTCSIVCVLNLRPSSINYYQYHILCRKTSVVRACIDLG